MSNVVNISDRRSPNYSTDIVSQPHYGLRRGVAALAIAGVAALGVRIYDNFNGAECSGEKTVQTTEGQKTFYSLAEQVPGGAPTGEVKDIIVEMNPGLDAGHLATGQVVEVPKSCNR